MNNKTVNELREEISSMKGPENLYTEEMFEMMLQKAEELEKRLKITEETHPSLWQLLQITSQFNNYDGTPFGCSYCKFSIINKELNSINMDDPDEGYYDCSLLNKQKIWGENPICNLFDWVKKAKEELSLI